MAAIVHSPLANIDSTSTAGHLTRQAEAIVQGDWEFRLLRLLPSQDRSARLEGNIVIAKFRDVKLHDAGNTNSATAEDGTDGYEALSYVWNEPIVPVVPYTADPVINIDGHCISVTRNLHAALNRLRLRDDSRLIFVDQLCIDQSNVAEKSRLVDRMCLIYGHCLQTVVWLGEEAEESFRAMLLIQRLAKLGRSHRGLDDLVRAVLEQAASPGPWKAMGKLFDRQWWHRTWTVQELAFPRDVVVVCGHRQLPWKDFRGALVTILRLIYGEKLSVLTLQVSLANLLEMDRTRRYTAERSGGYTPKLALDGLLQVLSRHRMRSAGLAQDKIFALYRLASDCREANINEFRHGLEADYTKAVAEVWTDTAKFFVLYNKTLDFLYHCRAPPDKELNSPTWVPDWSDTRKEPFAFRHERYSLWEPSSKFCADCTGSKLLVTAYLFDIVDYVGPLCKSQHDALCPAGCNDKHDVAQYPALVRTWLENCSPHDIAVSEESILEVTTAGASQHDDRQIGQPPAPRASPREVNTINDLIAFDKGFHNRAADYTKIHLASLCRRVCRSKQGRLLLAPQEIVAGDAVGMLMGFGMPVILRAHNSKSIDYGFVGPSYVQSVMSGELQSEAEKSFVDITLI